MAEIHEESRVPYAGWDRDCLQAARDRPDRRLGSRAGQRNRLGRALMSDETSRLSIRDTDEVIELQVSERASERTKRLGR